MLYVIYLGCDCCNSHKLWIHLQIEVCICAVVMADAVATGEVDKIVRLIDSLNFALCTGNLPGVALHD